MRPRRFALPQAGTGGYGIRPYVFEGAEPSHRGRCPACSFLPLSKTRSVGAHSICARGSLSYRKRARADMESAPTFLWRAVPPRRGRCPAWSFLPLVENEIRRGAFYMRPPKFALPQAGTGGYGIRPYVFCGGRSPPHRGGAPREVFSLWSKAKPVGAHSICARGGLSCRKRARADMESAPTFFVAGGAPRAEGAKGRVFACCACKRIYFVIFYNSQFTKNDRLSLNTNRRFCRYFSGFVPKKCQDTSSWIFGCPSACVPQQNPAH